jgi:hypothetical protein
MYFIQPTRTIPHLERVLSALPSLQMIHIEDISLYDQSIIAIADVQDFLNINGSCQRLYLLLKMKVLRLRKHGKQVL